jgi:hypothetical protein
VYFELLISTVQSKTDGQDGFSSLSSARIKNRASVPWPPAMDELKLELWGHESKQGTFLRDLEEKGGGPILLTFSGEKDPWKASSGCLVRSTLNDGERLLRLSSGEKNRMNRHLAFPSCSSMLQLLRTAVNGACVAAFFVR